MTPEQDRNARGRCARSACQAELGGVSYTHRHLGYRYCATCARTINRVCPEAPPFDLGDRALEAAFDVCPECSAPWRLHWRYSGPPADRRSGYNTCGLTREQLAAKWLPAQEPAP